MKQSMLYFIMLCLNMAVAGATGPVGPESTPPAASPQLKQPNILFIAIDDLRPELGCYGSPQVKSPNLDKLADQGIRFDRAYCQIAVCGASRASLMTGVLATKTRFKNHYSQASEDVPDAQTLPQVFRKAGYTTLSNGKIFHVPSDTAERSWSQPPWKAKADAVDPATLAKRVKSNSSSGSIFYEHADVADNAYIDGMTAERTIRDLQRLEKEGKPFFLACGFSKPHLPFYAPKRYWDLYKREDIALPNNRFRPEHAPRELKGSSEFRSYHLEDMDPESDDFHRIMRHGYMACVSYVDKLVGDLLGELGRLGLAENTIVIVWGDHGWHLGEHNFWGKHNTMHLATRVPLIIKAPGKATGGCKALVETSDLFPTLCKLANLTIPESVQGKSFVTLLDDPGQSFRDCAYSSFGSGFVVISDRYSYTEYNEMPGMLYDLEKDPDENVNVLEDPEYAKAVEMLKSMMIARRKDAERTEGLGKPVKKQQQALKKSNSNKIKR